MSCSYSWKSPDWKLIASKIQSKVIAAQEATKKEVSWLEAFSKEENVDWVEYK